jgi:adenylate kinase
VTRRIVPAKSASGPAARTRRPSARLPLALTGTPGTGKTAAARRLRSQLVAVEVSELAIAAGLGKRAGRTVVVDLAALRRRFPGLHRRRPADLYVGHLAHLLPIRDVLVLRTHPRVLADRLRRARRGTRSERHANVVAEATDLILLEAVGPRRRVWEVDTTRRSPASVAREVLRRFRVRGRSQYGRVRWLADPQVTKHLLDEEP